MELRYIYRDGVKVLQYRKYMDTTVWAGIPHNEERMRSAKYEWSDWIDVPTVYHVGTLSTVIGNPKTNRCTGCGIDFESASMGFVCRYYDCPNGL